MRMQSASLISTALGNLASTQSPILRQKILNLQLHQNPLRYGILDSVKNSITSLILRSTAIPKINTCPKQTIILTQPSREDVIFDEQVQDFDIYTTICHNDFRCEDASLRSDQRSEVSHGDEYVAAIGLQLTGHDTSIFETEPTTWDLLEKHTRYPLSDPVSPDLCETRELRDGSPYHHDFSDVAMASDNHDLIREHNDEMGAGCTVLNQDVMYPLSFDPGPMDSEDYTWDNETDNDIEAVEDDFFEISSHTNIRRETTCTPDLMHDVENAYAPGRGWIDDDAIISQNWHSVNSMGPASVAVLGIQSFY